MKFLRRAAICVAAAVIFLMPACSLQNGSSGVVDPPVQQPSEEERLELVAFNGETIDLCKPVLREYLGLEDEDAQAAFLYENRYVGQDGQAPVFSWSDDGSQSYTVYFADNAVFEDAVTIISEDEELEEAGFFLPGKTYYWKVEGDSGITEADSFSTLDGPIRMIEADGAYNIRDLGGWNTVDGKTVNYGMLYRGGQLNGYSGMDALTEKGKYVFNEILGIKSELDLRRPGKDDGGQSECWWNKDGEYVKISLSQYSRIVPGYKSQSCNGPRFDADAPAAIKSIFEFLGDKDNYPIYFHCNAGADRTGTLAFLILGLLGVSYEDITRDFETTSFTYYSSRWRSAIEDGKFTQDGVMQCDTSNFVAWGEMYSLIMSEYGEASGTLSDAVENYLISVCGVDLSCISTIKEIMLQ